MAGENVGSIEYTIDANTDPLLSANKSADASLSNLEASFNTSATASKKFDAQLTKTATAVKRTSSSFGFMRGQAQNLGYQLQDVAVQAQMGTSALTILGQQGSQFLGGFGGAGAIAGAFLAIGAAIGGVIQKTFSGTTAAKNYKTELELLQQTVKVTDDGLVVMSDGFTKLAEANPNVAMSKLKVQLDQVGSVVKVLSNDTVGLLGDFEITPRKINGANQSLKDFGGTAQEVSDLIGEKNFFGNYDGTAYMKELGTVQSVVTSLAEGLNITKVQAVNFVTAMDGIEGPEGIQAAASFVSDLARELDYANPEINKLNVAFAESSSKAGNLKTSQQALNNVIKDIGEASANGEKAIRAAIEANLAAEKSAEDLSNKILVQKAAMESGEEAAIRLSVAQQLGGLVSEELTKKVSDLAVEYYNLTKAQKEAQAAEKEQETINKNASKLAQDIATASKSEIDQIKEKAQAKRDLINASTELTQSEKAAAIGSIDSQEGDSVASVKFRIDAQDALGVSQEMASELEMLDSKFQDIGTTINDTLVGAALTFGDTIGDAVANGIAEGESFNEVMNNIGRTIATQVLSSLVSLGVQYGINAALQSAADQSVAASGTAALATTTAAGIAAAKALSAAWAPAAAGASTATGGASAKAGAAGLTTTYGLASTLSLAGGRLNGGAVTAGNAYEVTENGKPEMLTVGGKDILMMGNQSGTVTSNADLTSSGSGGVIVNVNNNASGATATATSSTSDGKTIIEVVVADIRKNGQTLRAITGNTTANYKPS